MPRQVGGADPKTNENAYETIVGKIMVMIEPLLSDDYPDELWMEVNLAMLQYIRRVWETKEVDCNTYQYGTTKYARKKAREQFGGHCGVCEYFDPEIACPTLDAKYPGCVNFRRKPKAKER